MLTGVATAGPGGAPVRGRGWLPQLLPQPEAKSRKGRREPELSVTRPVAQLSDKSRVNSSSYRNEALASHGGSQVLNVAPQTERNPGHSGAMADASKAADAVDATGSLSDIIRISPLDWTYRPINRVNPDPSECRRRERRYGACRGS